MRLLGLYLDEAPTEAFFSDPEGEVKGPRGEDATVANATFIQKSVLSRGALSLVGLLVAVTVFAIVITLALGRLVGQTTADRDLALQVAAARNGGGATGTSGLAGTVKLLSAATARRGIGERLRRRRHDQAARHDARPTGTALQLNQLAAGKYKLSFQRAGYVRSGTRRRRPTPTRRPSSSSPASNSTGSTSASAAYRPRSAAPSSATTSRPPRSTSRRSPARPSAAPRPTRAPRQLPAPTRQHRADADPNPLTAGAAIVQKVAVGADGTFTLNNVPSPNVY